MFGCGSVGNVASHGFVVVSGCETRENTGDEAGREQKSTTSKYEFQLDVCRPEFSLVTLEAGRMWSGVISKLRKRAVIGTVTGRDHAMPNREP